MIIDHYQYLLLLGGCLLVTAPLEAFGRGVYRQPRRTLTAILPVAVVFIAWDVLAVAGGVWHYDPRYVTGLRIGNMPIEELLFFVVIPLCGLLTYSAVHTILTWVGAHRPAKAGHR